MSSPNILSVSQGYRRIVPFLLSRLRQVLYRHSKGPCQIWHLISVYYRRIAPFTSSRFLLALQRKDYKSRSILPFITVDHGVIRPFILIRVCLGLCWQNQRSCRPLPFLSVRIHLVVCLSHIDNHQRSQGMEGVIANFFRELPSDNNL